MSRLVAIGLSVLMNGWRSMISLLLLALRSRLRLRARPSPTLRCRSLPMLAFSSIPILLKLVLLCWRSWKSLIRNGVFKLRTLLMLHSLCGTNGLLANLMVSLTRFLMLLSLVVLVPLPPNRPITVSSLLVLMARTPLILLLLLRLNIPLFLPSLRSLVLLD